MTSIRTLALPAAILLCSTGALSALALRIFPLEPCCSVVSVDAVKGAATVYNRYSGRIMQVADAALAKELKVGDVVDADAAMAKLVKVKGLDRTVTLREPDGVEPCCAVVAVVKDKATAEALLAGILANPNADPAEPVNKPGTNPAEPVNALRNKIKGADLVNGIKADFSSELNGAEPVNGIIVARNLSTGALHVLNASVIDPGTMGSVASPITGSVRLGDPVYVEPASRMAMLKTQTGTYAFNLRGIKKTSEPINDMKPWVVEADAKAQGRNGIIRTNWHEKSGAGYQRIYVYLPGKRDQNEYNENWKTEHTVMEGEYDLVINGMVLEKVPVKVGHATRIRLGALRSTAAYANQLHILDSKDRKVNNIQGGEVIALPIGIYHLKVGTRTVKVEIKENEVTEF